MGGPEKDIPRKIPFKIKKKVKESVSSYEQYEGRFFYFAPVKTQDIGVRRPRRGAFSNLPKGLHFHAVWGKIHVKWYEVGRKCHEMGEKDVSWEVHTHN